MTGGPFKHFWLTNPEWYDCDENNRPFLTDAAPEKARESFKVYLEWIEEREKRKNSTR